ERGRERLNLSSFWEFVLTFNSSHISYLADFALTYGAVQDYAVKDLIRLLSEKDKMGERKAIISILGQRGTKEAVDCLIELSETGLSGYLPSITSALAQAGTKKAVDCLIELSRTEHPWDLVCVASALAQAGTKEAVDRLLEWYPNETRRLMVGELRQDVGIALGKVYTKELFVSRIKSIVELGPYPGQYHVLYSACGYRSIELLNKEIKSPLLSNEQRRNCRNVLFMMVEENIDFPLRNVNRVYDFNAPSGQGMIELYFSG
ncbi:unnamed protein product, partial [marine sediment metagenome]